jgi:hypothetical protein
MSFADVSAAFSLTACPSSSNYGRSDATLFSRPKTFPAQENS